MASDITPERWQQIVRLFEAALELNASERAALLAEACAADEAVGREVKSLLSQVDSTTQRGIGNVAAMLGARSSSDRSSSPANPVEASHLPGDSELFESVSLFGGVDDVRYAPGRMVASRYRIVSLIGRGAMGEVYRADDLKVGQAVALKFAPPEVSRDLRWVARFTREVRLARRVAHPNVCRVYDIGEAEGRHYLSMEYIDGENLRSLLQRIGRLPFEKAVDIARQLCAGLAAAHDRGILHRDLKPANIMIDGRGHARITDFGLAMPIRRRRTHEIAGTPAYMAPEQVAGGIVTEQSDLFSLGLILYELLTGKRLLEATTLQERWITQQDGHDPRLLKSQMSADVDRGVALVIGRCLEHEPARRPASAREIAAALPGGGDPLAAAVAAGEIPLA
jgi:tRNA A-37 threonylcarbamoyl transferase component Bud32